jgi:GNAT superfamily N-acetyltransferase
MEIAQIERVKFEELEPLLKESLAEGYTLIEKLWNEYQAGTNRFDSPGAALLGVYQGGHLIGIGGVQADPYLKRPEIGRLRHVYVLQVYRRQGKGRRLVEALIQKASERFDLLTLRTHTAEADAFYRALGFEVAVVPEATHVMRLKRTHSEDPPHRPTRRLEE